MEKDSKGGPTFSGSPSWHNYLQLLETELRRAGVVDIFRNPFTYTRWHTTEWPDDSHWSVHVEGKKIKVASYGYNSGNTPEQGVTGELILYSQGMPAESLRGKIAVVFKSEVSDPLAPSGGASTGDYEYLSNPDTFPDPAAPRSEEAGVSPFGLMGLGAAQEPLAAAGAAGALLVLPISFQALAGTYTFGVPKLYDTPTLYIDRETGAELANAVRDHKKATLRLIASTEEAETYQLFGYLPGENYGAPDDKQISEVCTLRNAAPRAVQPNFRLAKLTSLFYSSD